MFCSNCGKEIPEGSQFCPECGAAVSGNGNTAARAGSGTAVMSPSKNEVFVRGYKCAGNSKYYAFTFFLPLAVAVLGALIYEGMPGFGAILIIVGIVFACIIRKIFKQSIMYDETQKLFVYNAHSKLNFTVKKIAVADVQRVRIRYVKVGLMDAKYSLNDPGKYHVIALDAADNNNSVSVWFSKNGNVEEFIPVIENAMKQNGKNIVIDRKEDLIKLAEFSKEVENVGA